MRSAIVQVRAPAPVLFTIQAHVTHGSISTYPLVPIECGHPASKCVSCVGNIFATFPIEGAQLEKRAV